MRRKGDEKARKATGTRKARGKTTNVYFREYKDVLDSLGVASIEL